MLMLRPVAADGDADVDGDVQVSVGLALVVDASASGDEEDHADSDDSGSDSGSESESDDGSGDDGVEHIFEHKKKKKKKGGKKKKKGGEKKKKEKKHDDHAITAQPHVPLPHATVEGPDVITAQPKASKEKHAELTGSFFCRYEEPNDWHYVEITHVDGNEYRWTNRAGVSWTLTKTSADDHLEVGTDCPYHEHGHTIMKYADDGEPHVLGPWDEKYYRVEKKKKDGEKKKKKKKKEAKCFCF